MRLHRHTVGYRLARVQEVSGLSPYEIRRPRAAQPRPEGTLRSSPPTGDRVGTRGRLAARRLIRRRRVMSTTENENTAAAAGARSAAEVLDFAAKRGVEMVDLKFVDLPGTWQHMTLPLGRAGRRRLRVRPRVRRLLDPRLPGDPRVRHAADPGPGTAFIDPYYTPADAVADLLDRRSGARASRTRAIPATWPRRPRRHLVSHGIADVAYFGPEAEFFVFDHIAYEQREHRAFYEVDSSEGFWNTGSPAGAAPNLAYKLARRRATSRFRRATRSPTCGPRWWRRWSRWGSAASFTTTRSHRAARARSTCASSRCCRWPIR